MQVLNKIVECEGSLDTFSKGYKQFGVRTSKEGIEYREWAPGAKEAYFVGDFSKNL